MPRNVRLRDALGGALKRKFQVIKHTDLTAAALTQQFAMGDLPAGAIVMGYDIELVTPFAGTTTLVVDLGDAGGAEYYDDFDLQGAAGRESSKVAEAASDGNGISVTALVTATGANVDQSTAGEARIALLYFAADDVGNA